MRPSEGAAARRVKHIDTTPSVATGGKPQAPPTQPQAHFAAPPGHLAMLADSAAVPQCKESGGYLYRGIVPAGTMTSAAVAAPGQPVIEEFIDAARSAGTRECNRARGAHCETGSGQR